MILELLQHDGLTPVKKTVNEYASPCPVCGGDDRFIVFTESDRYWCRQCEAKGDSIQYLRDFHGMSFKDATAAIGRPELLSLTGRKQSNVKIRKKQAHDKFWSKSAMRIIEAANLNLFSRNDILSWFLAERGITVNTVDRFNLGWLNSNCHDVGTFVPAGLVIPWKDKRIRIRLKHPQGRKTYHVVKGSSMKSMTINDHYGNTGIIVESELDAILLAQEIERPVFIVALGSAKRNLDKSLLDRLKQCPIVLASLDSDQAGREGVVKLFRNVENAFHAPIPSSAGKDHTEAYLSGLNLNEWLHLAMRLVEVRYEND